MWEQRLKYGKGSEQMAKLPYLFILPFAIKKLLKKIKFKENHENHRMIMRKV